LIQITVVTLDSITIRIAICVVIRVCVVVRIAGTGIVRTEDLSVIQGSSITGKTLTVCRRARHHTTMRTVTVVAHITVVGSITSSTVVLSIVVTVVSTTGFTTGTLTESACSAVVTTIATSVLG